MHKRTPLVMHGRLVVYHRVTDAHFQYYDPNSKEFSMERLGSYYSKPSTLNGEEFDPTGILTLDWKQIISPDMLIKEDYVVEFIRNADLRARLIGLKDIPPSQWHLINPKKPKTYAHLAPQKCLLRIGDATLVADLAGKVGIDWNDDGHIEGHLYEKGFKRSRYVDEDDESTVFEYDPNQPRAWLANQIPMVEKLLAEYDAYVLKKAENEKAERAGQYPDASGIMAEYDELAKKHKGSNPAELVDMILKSRAEGKRWHAKRRNKMADLITMTLMRSGRLQLAHAKEE